MIGDFNGGLDNTVLKDFCNLFNFTNLINKATCYKNPNNPSCIYFLIEFLGVCKEVLNIYAPLKKKYIRGNNSSFMNRILSKEIMKRSRLRNKFFEK